MKKQKGFTLIELLVVVAIIGILASVVLASLGKARNKAKNAAIMSEMSNLRAFAEMYASDNNDSYEGVCTSSNEINTITVDMCDDSAGAWAAYKKFVDTTSAAGYCVDSMGTAKKLDSDITSATTVCPDN